MSEKKAKHIHIEDGNAEAEETKAEDLKEEEAAAKEPETEEPQDKAEETAGEETAEEAEASADEAEASADEPSAEEQESERYMRLMAEFQNFKRRAAKEKSDIHAFANERIVGDLLPVLDNFERALDTETEDIEGYAKGMQLIFEQLKTALEKAGLKEIEALGQDFDPNVHNAVMTDNTDEYETDKISKVLQKGYKLNDKVVRPSMVAVNKK
ncbi:MAG: nucleotide exchange factor GrpE [Clostridiales bacterium]|nr:nucleotide exchange factor GrpE [Clostridiales bacterium]